MGRITQDLLCGHWFAACALPGVDRCRGASPCRGCGADAGPPASPSLSSCARTMWPRRCCRRRSAHPRRRRAARQLSRCCAKAHARDGVGTLPAARPGGRRSGRHHGQVRPGALHPGRPAAAFVPGRLHGWGKRHGPGRCPEHRRAGLRPGRGWRGADEARHLRHHRRLRTAEPGAYSARQRCARLPRAASPPCRPGGLRRHRAGLRVPIRRVLRDPRRL